MKQDKKQLSAVVSQLDAAKDMVEHAVKMNDEMRYLFITAVPNGMTDDQFSAAMAEQFPVNRETVAANTLHLISMWMAECAFPDANFMLRCNDIVAFAKQPGLVAKRIAAGIAKRGGT